MRLDCFIPAVHDDIRGHLSWPFTTTWTCEALSLQQTESTCRTAISISLHVASCPQERHLLTGKKTSFQSGCKWGCSLRIIIPLHTKRNTPSGKLLCARNIWVPSLECSIAKKWLLQRLDRLPTESNKEYHSLQTTSLCKKWPCKRGLCIFSKLTGLALGFASLHALVSSAAECQVSHLSILFNNSPKLHLLDQ
jgi:hypothetical protein